MRANEAMISITELQHLISNLNERQPGIGFRFRLLGEMWQSSFLKIVKVRGRVVYLTDELSGRSVSINDLAQIIQFELDGPYQSFQPYFHYEVVIQKELHR